MDGEKNLGILLASMKPEMSSESYVFSVFPRMSQELLRLNPWAVIREEEGYTAILEEQAAPRMDAAGQGVFRRITLNIHSSLEAVGLTAAVSSVLADAGISANVVAGCFHDHIFVPRNRAAEALRRLEELSREKSVQ